LIETIKKRLLEGPQKVRVIESVGSILTRTELETIENWYQRVEKESGLTSHSMSRELRCKHLPQVLLDLAHRLDKSQPIGSPAEPSPAATAHGVARRKQGYSAADLVSESRLLQVSIFEMLQENLATINISTLLLSVMIIADEIDSQLNQAMASYINESTLDALPA